MSHLGWMQSIEVSRGPVRWSGAICGGADADDRAVRLLLVGVREYLGHAERQLDAG